MSNIENFLENFAKNYGFCDFKLITEDASQKGDNYIGIVTRVQIFGNLCGNPSTLKIVVKAAPKTSKIRESIPTRNIFLREIYSYSEVFPELEKLQDDLHEADKFRFVKCYATNKEDMNELLVMEDLLLQGYRMHKPRLATLDFDHYSVALTALAKYHALSYVLQERNPKTFAKFATEATDIMFADQDSAMKKYSSMSAERAVKAMSSDLLRDKLKPFADNIFQIMCDLISPQKYAVLCHGDYWKNNMLFTYENGKPNLVCPLDYQVLRYSSPVTDIMYFILCCSSQELRKKHYWELLSVYHEALGDQLEKFSMDIEKVFPRSEFMAELKRVGSVGLGLAICVLMFMTCATEDIPDPADVVHGEVRAHQEDTESYKMYKERINGVVEDSIELGFL